MQKRVSVRNDAHLLFFVICSRCRFIKILQQPKNKTLLMRAVAIKINRMHCVNIKQIICGHAKYFCQRNEIVSRRTICSAFPGLNTGAADIHAFCEISLRQTILFTQPGDARADRINHLLYLLPVGYKKIVTIMCKL